MNRSIEHELNVLFAEWESKMKANDNTSHFTRDGLMYNSLPNEQNEDFWFSSSKRVLFLLKDQNQQGMEKWDEDIREWLIDTVNDKTESQLRIRRLVEIYLLGLLEISHISFGDYQRPTKTAPGSMMRS